jgi:hypothetical protein
MSPESRAILDKVGDEEPIFILRASDALAPSIVNEWIRAARRNGVNADKIASATRHLQAIWDWQAVYDHKLPD